MQLRALRDLINRCNPPLKEFSFSSSDTSDDDLLAVLRLMPTLESLALHYPINLSLISAITYSSTNPVLPCLKTISFGGTVHAGLQNALSHLVAFVQSRDRTSDGFLEKLWIFKVGNEEVVEALKDHPSVEGGAYVRTTHMVVIVDY